MDVVRLTAIMNRRRIVRGSNVPDICVGNIPVEAQRSRLKLRVGCVPADICFGSSMRGESGGYYTERL